MSDDTKLQSGWRPVAGWVCVAALGYWFILRDIGAWVAAVAFPAAVPPASVAMEHLVTVVLALLGLGGLRTMEKWGSPWEGAVSARLARNERQEPTWGDNEADPQPPYTDPGNSSRGSRRDWR